MENRQLITKNKKIFIKKYFINLEAIPDPSNKLIVKTLYSTCKHGTEKWVIEKKAHWLKYNRDRKSNYFTSNLKADFKKEKNLGNMIVGKIIKVSVTNVNKEEFGFSMSKSVSETGRKRGSARIVRN